MNSKRNNNFYFKKHYEQENLIFADARFLHQWSESSET
jgi:hypothetical protein